MNNKAQFGFIKILAFAGVFIIFFALALAPFIRAGLESSDLTVFGTFGAWIVGAMPIWILLAFVLLVLGLLLWGFAE